MTFSRLVVLAGLVAMPAGAQLGLPPLIGDVVRGLPGQVGPIANETVRSASALARVRIDRIAELVSRNRPSIDIEDRGNPARRGELLIVDPRPQDIATAAAASYTLVEQGEIEGIGVRFARVSIPVGMSLAKAERGLKRLLTASMVSADHLHFQSSSTSSISTMALPPPALPKSGGIVGLIDGGVGGGIAVVQSRGFASGAPAASEHGTAVASLLAFADVARIVAADVYGSDPAGGSALSVSRALGWMTALRVPVVTISLVGPDNPLLARTIAAASARGTIVVAAVGNDGPAAPPAYPASYPGVVAVTAVDGRNRALIEAGRALHLDYAAPGADMMATGLTGRAVKVRGTSFAAPLVAARIASAYAGASNRQTLFERIDAGADDLGAKGTDRVYGRGLVCGECRRTK